MIEASSSITVTYRSTSLGDLAGITLSQHLRIGQQRTGTTTMPKVFGWDEVSGHSKPEDLYLVIDGNVYDVTMFQHEHPYVDKRSPY